MEKAVLQKHNRGTVVEVVCQKCGKSFLALAYKVRKGLSRYCSRECFGKTKVRKVTGMCECCGKKIESYPSRIKRFCSAKCAAPFIAEKRGHKIAEWNKNHPDKMKERGRKISQWYGSHPEEVKELGERISIIKRHRAETDPEHKAQLVRQTAEMRDKKDKNDSWKQKRLNTISQKYTKEQRAVWASYGGRGHEPWNKGLSKESDERIATQARGLMGHKPNPGSGIGKCGWRDDIGMFVRSTWEADVVRVFQYLGIEFEYEKKTFRFKDTEGNLIDTMLPDFYLPRFNLWVEVSGWMSKQKTEKIKLFREQYPKENLFSLDVKVYTGLRDMFAGSIPNWEGKGVGIGDCNELLKFVA